MKISYNWLQEYIKTELTTEKIGEHLTDIGLEVEGIEKFESVKGSLAGILVGKVLTCELHPNADKLKITTVDVGSSTALKIVCGAPNVAAGQTVPVAVVGTELFMSDGKPLVIKEAKIRGEVSQGMICAEDELGLSADHDGIMVLDDNIYKVGTPFSDYFDLASDEVFEIGLTPNRTDAMSHYGVARDLHAYLSTNHLPNEFSKVTAQEITTEGNSEFEIEIENSQLCPRYCAAVMQNVKVQESPKWLQNRIKAIGLSPINNVVDISNYILHDLGQPVHIFDAAKINGRKVIVGTAPEGTQFTTLDGVERKLNGSEIMIKDGTNKPMCIAGVFGGLHSGVSPETTEIFIESAYFNPVATRKAAKSHGLNTDASFRFERGVDPHMTKTALLHAAELIGEITGATMKGNILEFYPEEIEDHTVILRYSKLDQILGAKIHRQKVLEILKSLEITVLNEIQDGLELSVPAYRADVVREIDVIEEILRIYGYNKIESPKKISFTPASLTPDDQDALENFWAGTLQSKGFNEVMNNSLGTVTHREGAVQLLNPLSSDLAFLRNSLLEGLLENADYNIKRKNGDIKFFEFGKVYEKTNAAQNADVREKYAERKQLALLISGRDIPEGWLQLKSATDFYKLKSYVSLLLTKLGAETEEIYLEDARFSEGIQIKSGNQVLAKLGKVAKHYLEKADIEQECFYAEVELEVCQKAREKQEMKFKEIPKFNTLRRDLALLVDKNVTYAELYGAALKNKSNYLKKISLFDVYEGKNLPEGKKSYAMSFELLNTEKTLEEKDISEVMNSLIKTFEVEFKAELRK